MRDLAAFNPGLLLEDLARTDSQGIAVIGPSRSWTWRELHRHATACGEGLAGQGVGSGTRVAINGLNGPSWLVAATAIAARDAVSVPLNIRWAQTERDAWLARSGARGILHVDTDDRNATPEWQDLAPAGTNAGDVHWARDLMTLMATSGSTGSPLGIGLRPEAHAAHIRAHLSETGLGREDRVLVVLPLFHIGGLNAWWRALATGSTLILLPRFEVAGVTAAYRDHAPTMASMTGTMLRTLLTEGVHPGPGMRYLLAGGEALPEEVGRAMAVIRGSYGMTETCGHVAFGEAGAAATQGVHMQPGTRVAVLGEDGTPLGPGRPGRIAITGPTLCRGWLDEHGSWQPQQPGLPLLTRDFGHLADDGRLILHPRPESLILSGGENISPVEIEAVLEKLPEVARALVAGVPDPHWGMRPAALVVPVAGIPEATVHAALFEALTARLGRFKHPKAIHLVRELPVLASGKLDRKEGARCLVRLEQGGDAPSGVEPD
ncbi:MAG: AMP-binding protein [Candidatus Sericytochromatia bacterium]|nr:AMP-binding protein [Candidatus Tanganyikabacteria bacterium]